MNSWQTVRDAVAVFVFVLLFAAVPATMIGLSIHEIIETREWMHRSVATSAIVEERHRHGDDQYEATVLFSPVEGEEVSATVVGSKVGEPGSVVAIRYDPENPNSARLAPVTRFWIGPAVGMLFSGSFLAIPLSALVAIVVAAVRSGSRAVSVAARGWLS